MAYAENTSIPVEKTIADIVAMLKKAGASSTGQHETDKEIWIFFQLSDRFVRFRVTLMTAYTGPRYAGNGREINAGNWIAQRNRQRARALMLVIKAKLESVESSVETFEEAFFANVVMADGATVYERARQAIALEYDTGRVQSAQLMLGAPS